LAGIKNDLKPRTENPLGEVTIANDYVSNDGGSLEDWSREWVENGDTSWFVDLFCSQRDTYVDD
jgi:hypothetical protein